jgi:hypothetical protein
MFISSLMKVYLSNLFANDSGVSFKRRDTKRTVLPMAMHPPHSLFDKWTVPAIPLRYSDKKY